MSITIIMRHNIRCGHEDWLEITVDTGHMECTLRPNRFQDLPFPEACELTARRINERYGHVYICQSGGYDSELVCETFLRAGLPFTPVIVDIGINRAEITQAIAWCNTNDVLPVLHQMSEEEYLRENLRISFKTPVHSYWAAYPVIAAEMLQDQGGKILTGNDDPWSGQDDIERLLPQEIELLGYSYLLDFLYPDRHPSAFFTYTPEFFYSLIKNADYTVNRGTSKNRLYGLRYRDKIIAEMTDGPFYQQSERIMGSKRMRKLGHVLGNKDQVIDWLDQFVIA